MPKVAQLVLKVDPSRKFKQELETAPLEKKVYDNEDRKPRHLLMILLDENRYTAVTSGSSNENINVSLSHLIKMNFP